MEEEIPFDESQDEADARQQAEFYSFEQQRKDIEQREREQREWLKQWREAWTRWARTEHGSKTTNEPKERNNA